ncbi:SET domain-containing protein [Acephala macrosclerotiorum]|nr:SET domain-containing protein [Acephala macrosclerotiorum]
MINSVKIGKVHLDHADFLSNTEIRQSPGKGRGLFATRDIKRREIVMVEKACCMPDLYTSDQDRGEEELRMWNFNINSKTQRPAQATLFLELLKEAYEDPAAAKRIFNFDGGYIRSGREGEVIDGVPVVDSYTHAAYINHTCTPNAIRSFIRNIMTIRSTCPIPAGTEIVHQYRASDAAYLTRLKVFQENWGFECSCPPCAAESQSPTKKHKEREKLFEKLKHEMMKSSKISLARTKNVEEMTTRLEGLHEGGVYDGIPRLLLIHPCTWLMEPCHERGEWEMVIRWAGDVLRNFGFGEDGIMNTEAMQALKDLDEGYRALGGSELGKECKEVARGMFVVLTGSEVGVDEFFVGKG